MTEGQEGPAHSNLMQLPVEVFQLCLSWLRFLDLRRVQRVSTFVARAIRSDELHSLPQRIRRPETGGEWFFECRYSPGTVTVPRMSELEAVGNTASVGTQITAFEPHHVLLRDESDPEHKSYYWTMHDEDQFFYPDGTFRFEIADEDQDGWETESAVGLYFVFPVPPSSVTEQKDEGKRSRQEESRRLLLSGKLPPEDPVGSRLDKSGLTLQSSPDDTTPGIKILTVSFRRHGMAADRPFDDALIALAEVALRSVDPMTGTISGAGNKVPWHASSATGTTWFEQPKVYGRTV